MAASWDGQDAKAQKLAAKIEGKAALSGGHGVLVAVPVKRGSLGAAAAGALSGSGRGVAAARDRSRRDVDQGATAGTLLKMIGDGSDFVLCCTDADLRIIRFVGFGILGSTPTIVPPDTMQTLTVDDGTKQAHLVFGDGSTLPFKVPKDAHRAALRDAAAVLWPPAP